MAVSGPSGCIFQSSKVAFDDVTHSAHSMATQESVKDDQSHSLRLHNNIHAEKYSKHGKKCYYATFAFHKLRAKLPQSSSEVATNFKQY